MDPTWRARACYIAAALLCLAYIIIVPGVDLIDICAGAGLGAAAMWALNDWEAISARRAATRDDEDLPARRSEPGRRFLFGRRHDRRNDYADEDAYGDFDAEPEDVPMPEPVRRQEYRPAPAPVRARPAPAARNEAPVREVPAREYPDREPPPREAVVPPRSSLLARAYEEFHRPVGREDEPREPLPRESSRQPRAWERDLPEDRRAASREPPVERRTAFRDTPREPEQDDEPISSGRTAPNPPRFINRERPDPRNAPSRHDLRPAPARYDEPPAYDDPSRYSDDMREAERAERYRALIRRTDEYLSGERRNDEPAPRARAAGERASSDRPATRRPQR